MDELTASPTRVITYNLITPGGQAVSPVQVVLRGDLDAAYHLAPQAIGILKTMRGENANNLPQYGKRVVFNNPPGAVVRCATQFGKESMLIYVPRKKPAPTKAPGDIFRSSYMPAYEMVHPDTGALVGWVLCRSGVWGPGNEFIPYHPSLEPDPFEYGLWMETYDTKPFDDELSDKLLHSTPGTDNGIPVMMDYWDIAPCGYHNRAFLESSFSTYDSGLTQILWYYDCTDGSEGDPTSWNIIGWWERNFGSGSWRYPRVSPLGLDDASFEPTKYDVVPSGVDVAGFSSSEYSITSGTYNVYIGDTFHKVKPYFTGNTGHYMEFEHEWTTFQDDEHFALMYLELNYLSGTAADWSRYDYADAYCSSSPLTCPTSVTFSRSPDYPQLSVAINGTRYAVSPRATDGEVMYTYRLTEAEAAADVAHAADDDFYGLNIRYYRLGEGTTIVLAALFDDEDVKDNPVVRYFMARITRRNELIDVETSFPSIGDYRHEVPPFEQHGVALVCNGEFRLIREDVRSTQI